MKRIKKGDLVRFRHPWFDREKGVFLVVLSEHGWVGLHNGPDVAPHGGNTLHAPSKFEVVSEGR